MMMRFSQRVNLKRAAQLLFLLSIASLIACTDPVNSIQLSGSTMGTGYHITVVVPEQVEVDESQLRSLIDQRLQQLNQRFSTYIDDSELSMLNKAAIGEPVVVSQELFDVLVLSLEVGWTSGGAFDITVGPLVDLWGFGGGSVPGKDVVPSDQAIQNELDNVGFSYVDFDLLSTQVTKRKAVSIDLSAVAKGYAVDQVADLLLEAGMTDYMVEVGGELRLHGNSPRGTLWRIAIEEPDNSIGGVHKALNLSDVALATSGDYRNYFEVDGQRYSHTIDPLTGRPVTHDLASVTVVAETAAYADAMATAINVMGAEEGLALAQELNLPIYLIVKTDQGFESKYNDAFKPYLN